jgi:hypothetical protein
MSYLLSTIDLVVQPLTIVVQPASLTVGTITPTETLIPVSGFDPGTLFTTPLAVQQINSTSTASSLTNLTARNISSLTVPNTVDSTGYFSFNGGFVANYATVGGALTGFTVTTANRSAKLNSVNVTVTHSLSYVGSTSANLNRVLDTDAVGEGGATITVVKASINVKNIISTTLTVVVEKIPEFMIKSTDPVTTNVYQRIEEVNKDNDPRLVTAKVKYNTVGTTGETILDKQIWY